MKHHHLFIYFSLLSILLLLCIVSVECRYENGQNGQNGSGGTISGGKKKVIAQDEELEAIKDLHKSLDVDEDGTINVVESEKFLKGETDMNDRPVNKKDWIGKQKAFHKLDTDQDNDDYISVHELQAAWIYSPVRRWSVDEVAKWVTDKVKLPQYAAAFKRYHVDGKRLPYLAVNNGKALREDIGVSDQDHLTQFINRITLDVVFGGEEPSNTLKDFLLAVLAIALPLVLGLFCKSNYQTKAQDRKLQLMSESLLKAQKSAEEYQNQLNESSSKHTKHLQDVQEQKRLIEYQLQREIDEAKLEALKFQTSRQNADVLQQRLAFAEKELDQLRSALRRAEEQLASVQLWRQTDDLKILLQRTYALEYQIHALRRQDAEMQFNQAQEALSQVTKKRANFLGSFKIAHGGSMDTLSDSIHTALQYLTRVRKEMDEFSLRWQQIEDILSLNLKDSLPQMQRIASINGRSVSTISTSTSSNSLTTLTSSPSTSSVSTTASTVSSVSAVSSTSSTSVTSVSSSTLSAISSTSTNTTEDE